MKINPCVNQWHSTIRWSRN